MSIVEREEQLAELRDLYADVVRGQGRVALVDGGVASGKTELAGAVAGHAAEAGALVLTATGSVAESEIPFGIVGQLCHSARAQGAQGASLPDADLTTSAGTRTLGPGEARLLESVCQLVLELAADRPVVLVVDDVQFADPLSAQALLYLQRRIRAARVFLVLSGCVAARPAGSAFRAELTRQPHCTHLRLLPLSPDGIRRLLATRLASAVAARLAAPVHILSGGSPVLAHALADDFLAAPTDPVEPVVGEAFVQAALACLHRSDPRLLDVARAVAILGPDHRTETVAALAGLTHTVAEQVLAALRAAGLVDNGSFPHPAVRAAVLADCPPDVQTWLRKRAASLLHGAAAPAADVAGQLVALGDATPRWGVPVLVAAADDALALGDTAHALRCLELAHATTGDDARRAAVEASLVRVHWRDKPAGVPRYLTSLHEYQRAGHLGDADALLLARALAWHGRTDAAAEVLTGVAAAADPDLADDHRATLAWVRRCGPDTVDADAGLDEAVAVDRAERTLQRARAGASVLVGVWQALLVLVHSGQLDRAANWADRLYEEARARSVTNWRAVLSDVRAAIALRRGDLAAAEQHAVAALSAMSAGDWGVAAGSPLAHLVQAYTLSGQLAKAEETLWLPTPSAMRHSMFWPGYLLARGAYYEAVDRAHAALADFRAAGEHAIRWRADHPAALPWRVDLARVHVGMGRQDKARDLVTEHLALPGAAGPRTKGMALRVLASACPPKQRQTVLREAMDLLHTSGDRHELAHAFADLSETGHALGEFGRAKMMGRRALQLADECHAEPVRGRLRPPAEDAVEDERVAEPPDGFAALSDAERRVVNLAARGHTNREIGHKLFITVSTVEQHLTKAYRKLNVSRRTDLVPVGPVVETYA